MTAFLGPDVRNLGAAYIDSSARIFGDVEIGSGASIWCNVVVRAESDRVVIGTRANIQDFVMIHVGPGPGRLSVPTVPSPTMSPCTAVPSVRLA